MNSSIVLRHGGILALFAAVTTALIVLTYQGTRERIAEQVLAKRLAILNEVIPENFHTNELHLDCVTVNHVMLGGEKQVYRSRMNGAINGYAIESTTAKGYSGDLDLIVGVTSALKVLGVRVLQHKETPGLGDKVELSVSDWVLSFTNKQYAAENQSLWQVKKDGGQFDQFTGATITPRAVVNQVAQTLQWLQQNQSALVDQPNTCEAHTE